MFKRHLQLFSLFVLLWAATQTQAQIIFSLVPNNITPNVGDTVRLNVTVKNFTNIISAQYSIDWDATLFKYVGIDKRNLPDSSNLQASSPSSRCAIVVWNANSTAGTVPDGQAIYRLTFVITNTSSNYWMRFGNTCQTAEIIGNGGVKQTPTFNNLGNPPGVQFTPITVTTTGSTVQSQQSVVVPVTVAGFTKIISSAWQTQWDPTVLRFDSISNFNTTLGLTASNFTKTNVSTGALGFTYSASPANKTLVDNDTLFKIYFKAIGNNGTSSTVQPNANGAAISRSDAGTIVPISLVAATGTVKVSLPVSTALSFFATNESGYVGDKVCVRVFARNFTNIASTNWSMHWDSTKIKFLSAALQDVNLGSDSLGTAVGTSPKNTFTTSATLTGTLKYLWQSPNAGNLSIVGDSVYLFNVCFQILGGPNSAFTFDGIPLKIALYTINSQNNIAKITATYTNGSVVVSNAPQPVISSGITKNITCNAGNDGSITQTVSGGNGTFTYSWSGPNNFTANTKDLTNLKAGTYYVTIVSGTLSKNDTFKLVEPSGISIANTITEVPCFGQSVGGINSLASGGTAPYKFVWSSGETTSTISNKVGGDYFVTVTDAAGCKQNSAKINIPTPTSAISIASASTIVPATCKSGADGQIKISIQGGTPTYTYNWSGPNGYSNTNPTIISLRAGAYSLTATDSKGCTTSASYVITEPDSIKVASVTTTNSNCGSKTGSISVNGITGGTGTYTYAWSGANGFFSSSATTPNLSNLVPGTYSLVVTDAKNCVSATISAVVNNTASTLSLSTPTIVSPLCNGQNTGSISVTVSGGVTPYKYLWGGPGGFSDTAVSIKNLKIGAYAVLVTDANGCTVSANTLTINQPDAIVITAPKINVITCKVANAKGTIDLSSSVSGGTGTLTYSWSNLATTAKIDNLSKGDYTVTITDANQCTVVKTFSITEPTDSFKIMNVVSTDVSCFGAKNGAINITIGGGTAPLTFAWTGVGGFNSNTQNLSATLDAGAYFLNVTDANNCKVTNQVTIKQPNDIVITPTVTASSVNNCDGAIVVSASGGSGSFSYNWSGAGVQATSQNQTFLCRGTYSVTVTDSKNCSKTASVFVDGSSTGISIADQTISPAGCPGQNLGSIKISPTGGTRPYTYEWYDRSSPTSIINRTQNLTAKSAGSYFVKITDNIGQAYLSGDFVIQGSATNITVALKSKQNETCNGNDGSIYLDVRGGTAPYTYAWNDGKNFRDRPNISKALYSVVVTDQSQCIQNSDSYSIDRDACPVSVLQSSSSPTCNDSKDGTITINITNGEPGYSIRFTNTSGLDSTIKVDNRPARSASVQITSLAADTYSFTITDSKNQTYPLIVVLQTQSKIVVTKSITDDIGTCNGSVVLDVKGGTLPYTYVWNKGETSRDLSNLCADRIVSVSVRDSKGCSVQTPNDTIKLRYTTMSVNAVTTNGICPEDTAINKIEITVIGGAPNYTYEWRNDQGVLVSVNKDLTGVRAGTYKITVKDNAKPTPQTVTNTYTLKAQSDLKIASVSTIDATTTSTGQITVNVIGGKSPFTFKLNTGITSATGIFGGLAAGTYSVSVTDAQGCSDSKTGVIIKSTLCATVSKNVNPTYHGFDIKCSLDQNGSATVTNVSSDYAEPITYVWSNSILPNDNGKSSFSLKEGKQTVTVKDKNGKTCSVDFEILAPDKFTVRALTIDPVTLEASPAGGIPPYRFVWSTADTIKRITNLKPLDYTVFAYDFNNCTAQDYVRLNASGINCLSASTAFTPDGDGKNENFNVNTLNCNYANVRLEVYNRWGQLLYSKDNYAGEWKGRSRDNDDGEALPDGVYIVILKGVALNGEITTKKATVTIVRS